MERDMSARRIYGEEETPEGAAGSEFGKKQRDEARRKKFGIVTREFKPEDQPWVLKVNGKDGKKWGNTFFQCLYLLSNDPYVSNSDVHGMCFFCQVQRSEEGWCHRKCILLHLHAVCRRGF